MNRVDLLKKRRLELLSEGEDIRKVISSIIDEKSFVETGVYSFSKCAINSEKLCGEGVVTGYATVSDNPLYIVAQNFAVQSGGITKAQCDKILKCMTQAQDTGAPILYILNTHGILIGEGICALEGMSSIIKKAAQLKGAVPQFSYINGDCFGSLSLLAGICDFNFMNETSVLATASPTVISAKSGKNLPAAQVAGYKVHSEKTGLCSFYVKNGAEISACITKILEFIPAYGGSIDDFDEVSANKAATALKAPAYDVYTLIDAVFDKGYLELNKDYEPQVKCIIGRVGGIAGGAVAFKDGNGVELTAKILKKISEFYSFAASYDIPVINLVNTLALEQSLCAESGDLLKCAADTAYSLSFIENARIAVVYGKAVGAGYSLFAAKSMGYDFCAAFADAKVSLFDDTVGSEVEFSGQITSAQDREKFRKIYSEETSDPISAASGGYIDDIIEPEFVKQYVISALQMNVR